MQHAMSRRLTSCLIAALAWCCAGSAPAAAVRSDNIEAELVARDTALAPGMPSVVGLRLKHDPHWHTYWQNPGDSGMPTTLQWRLPAGTKFSQILWPVPKRIPIPPLMNHGYEGEVVLPVEIRLPADWPAGQEARLGVRADWLVCKDVCIPGGADLTLNLPVVAASAAPEPRWAKLFDAAFAAMPAGPVTKADATTADGKITLRIAGPAPVAGREVFVLSTIEGLVESAAPQVVRRDGDANVITLAVTSQLSASEPRIAGVVVGLGERALTFEAAMPGKLVPGPGIDQASAAKPVIAGGGEDLSLALAILFALAGGLVLNLMPCVFPLLSLKVLGFARGGGNAAMRINGMAFGAGVVLSFVALAVLLLALRAAGEAVGWGFQLQSPPVVAGLAFLFFALGLNLSGVFEFESLLPQSLAGATLKHPAADAFLSGVLAAVVASPCTAPFMGAALGYAVTQNAASALAVFAALGAGMALPYLLLAWFPAWRRHLPKPGPWLATFKQLLAFPMYATVVWLAWVLLLQIGVGALPWLGGTLVAISLGAWFAGRRGGAGLWKAATAAVLAGAVTLTWPGGESVAGDPQTRLEGWVPYAKADIAALNAAGTPVFVDFTAAWCVTCQVNKKVVLETTSVRQAFAAKSVKLMRADWTRRDPAITAALAEFGRNGVPVYVLYAPDKAPVLLPEILTERVVTDALKPL
jgi:thiol:disulfide interchange protein DsbD